MRPIRVVTDSFPDHPVRDMALSRAVLQRVSEGKEPETLRLYRPRATLAFGPQDARAPGYIEAVRLAREGGFEVLQRLAGGRAAAYHRETIVFGWAIPNIEPHTGIEARFQEVAGIVAAALRQLGVDARVGEVAGEYCPGRYSVNARGEMKLMGVGQRVVSRAAYVGGVVVVDGAALIRDILLPVYAALELPWDPGTVGSVTDETRAITWDTASQVLLSEFASRYALLEGSLAPGTLSLAETLEPQYVVA